MNSNQPEESTVNASPLPQPQRIENPLQMTFPEAIAKVIDGKRITRVEWSNPETYGLLKDGLLQIRISGEFKTWLISDGDLLAIDWIVLSDLN